MSVMFEVFYAQPRNEDRESRLVQHMVALGGRLDLVEEAHGAGPGRYVCLSFEFDNWSTAEHAADALRQCGEHVEGPQDYGD